MPPITGTHVFLSTVNETCFVVLLTTHSDANELTAEKHSMSTATIEIERKERGMESPLHVGRTKQAAN